MKCCYFCNEIVGNTYYSIVVTSYYKNYICVECFKIEAESILAFKKPFTSPSECCICGKNLLNKEARYTSIIIYQSIWSGFLINFCYNCSIEHLNM